MLLKFPTTKTHFTFSAPAAQLIAAEMSQAHEQRTLFYLKGLGRFFIFISTSLPCGAQKKILRGHFFTLSFCIKYKK
jgi:hypothetical protein